MRRFLLILLIVIFVCLLFFSGCGDDETTLFAEDPNEAVIYKSGDITVLELHGDYREMGRQYGALMKDELQEFYTLAIVEHFVGEKELPLDVLKELFQKDFDIYPERFKNILYGMAETSGMELSELILLDQIAVIGAVADPYNACSAIAAWGDYTNNNILVFGRNFDYPEGFKKFSKYMVVAVYNPDDGSIPVASLGWAGQVQTLNGMNKEGLFLEVNAGTLSGGTTPVSGRVTPLILLLSFLFDDSTMTQLEASLNTNYPSISFLVNAADKNRAYSYEWWSYGVKRSDGENEGLLVSTNHFVHPDWDFPLPSEDDSSMVRRRNLLALGEKYKGQFDDRKMMEVLDTMLEDGGATKSAETIFQIVAVPEKLQMWVKIRDQQDWTLINLNNSF